MSIRRVIITMSSLWTIVFTDLRLHAQDTNDHVKKFIEMQNKMQPVTGEAYIDVLIPTPSSIPKTTAPNTGSTRIQNTNRNFHGRWSFDRRRDLLDPYSDSPSKEKFLIDGDTMIEGNSRSMNVSKNTRIGTYRPASFFFLNGETQRWTDVLKNDKLEFSSARQGDLHVITVKTSKISATELTLDAKSGRLLKALSTMDKYAWKLEISEYLTVGDKFFPKSAKIDLYNTQTNEVLRSDALRTIQVSFPVKKEDIDKAFSLNIPKNTLIADRLLNGGTKTDRSLDAGSILNKPDTLKLQPFVVRPPEVDSLTNSVGVEDGKPFGNYLLYAGVAFIVFAVFFGCKLLFRVMRAKSS